PLVEQDEARALTLALSSSAPRALEFTARRVASIASDESIDLLVATLRDNANDDERALAILRGTNAAFTGQKYGRLPEGWEAVERMLGASANARVRTEVQALALTFGSAPARAE